MGHAGTAAAAAAPAGGDLEHSTETIVALTSELAQQQVQPACLHQPDSQQQQQHTQQVSQPAIMQQAPQHLQKDTQYQQLRHQATQYQQLLVQHQALQQQYASLAGQLQQQQQPQALQHLMSQSQQRQQEHEHNLLQLQLHAGDQGLPSQQQALEQLEQRLHPEGQAQAEPLLAGTVECCAPAGVATSKVSAGEEQGLANMASASGTGSREAAEPFAGPQQPPLIGAPEGVGREILGILADSDGGSSTSGAAGTSASRPVSAAAAPSSHVDSASNEAASNACADGAAPVRSMQRLSSSHRNTQTTTVTVVTTSSTLTSLSTEHSSSSSDGGGGASRDAGSNTTITASSSQQHLTFSSVQQHSEAGVSGKVTAGCMGSSACPQSADAQAPAQMQTGAAVANDSAGSLVAALPMLPTGQLLFSEDFHATRLSPSMLSNSPASGAGSAGFLPSVLPGLLVPSASAAAAAAGLAAPDLSSPAAPFGSSRMGGHHTPAELQFNSRSFGSSDSFGSSSNSLGVGGASLAGFVSIATYQEQMQSVAKLHGEVGQLAVQLREAHADAEGAQQLLQQERKVRAHCLRAHCCQPGMGGWRGRRW